MTTVAPVPLSAAEAEAAVERGELTRPALHAVWDVDSQSFLRLGEKIALDTQRRASDPDELLADFLRKRDLLLRFVAEHLSEAEYDDRGWPRKGRLNDYYLPEGAERWCLTKTGAEKLAGLFKYKRSGSRTAHLTETPDYVSATVHCTLMDAFRNPVGAYEAAASTAEAGFQRPEIREKYGAVGAWKGDRDDRHWTETQGPDYRAALNDVVARAGKRAFVGAVIVAVAADEVFEIGGVGDDRRDEDDRRLARKPVTDQRSPIPGRQAAASEASLRKRVFINNTPLSMYSTVEILGFLQAAIEKPAECTERERAALEQEVAFRMKEAGAT